MACIVCDHTMQGLGLTEQSGWRHFWCPNCGTIKSEANSGDHWETPRLIAEVWQMTLGQRLSIHDTLLHKSNLTVFSERAMKSGASIERRRFVPAEPPSGTFLWYCGHCFNEWYAPPPGQNCPKCGTTGVVK